MSGTAKLTKPILVPEFSNGLIKMYIPNARGIPTAKPDFAVDVQSILDSLFPGEGRVARPNTCKLRGDDLFFSISSSNSQAVIKLPGYLTDPAKAITQAFVFTLTGNDYVGLAINSAGHLFVAEGDFKDNKIVRYTGVDVAFPGAANASSSNFATRLEIGNAGATSYFANLVFDASGNLWVSDYLNHRIIAFDADTLGGANTFHVLPSKNGPLDVANTNPGLNAPSEHLFAEPEGVDIDDAGVSANLWVANNNDGGGLNGVQNKVTSIVKVSKSLLDQVLATARGAAIDVSLIKPNENCFIYNVPASAAGMPQFGGLQVDRDAKRVYVNEQVAGDGRAYDLATIDSISTSPADTQLAITSTNPGNGGIALLS